MDRKERLTQLKNKFESTSRAHLHHRPRRNRRTNAIRQLVKETHLTPEHLVLPLFVMEGENQREPISSMPGHYRLSRDLVIKTVKEAQSLGIKSVALFPVIPESKKDSRATVSKDPNGLLPTTVRELKNTFSDLCVFTDVAMDPYSSEGHDGLVVNGKIVNDETLEILAEMAMVQAQAGADYVAPSDMMDGRIGFIREALDQNGFHETGILSYAAKYTSAFYGPFREALDSTPRFGDKKTYQMDPANSKEAVREVLLDLRQGADIVMVKPALCYLDIIARIKKISTVPIAAYNVSGEYSMIKLAAQNGLIDEKAAALESLLSIRRAGADIIFTYWALSAAEWIQ